MSSLRSLSRAMALGFFRDRTALFFTVLFPLMFLVLFGGIFANQSAPRVHVLQIGSVALLDQIPADQKGQLDKALEVTQDNDRADAISQVQRGDVDAAVEQNGQNVVLHFSEADQVKAATVEGLFASLVDSGNLVAAHAPTAFVLDPQQVEDQSLKTIQYVTPGLLGWAIATGATFGAALTLITWRQKKVLRRLRLSPVRTSSIVGARVGVSVIIALVQMAIFLGVASVPYFGLKLSAYWWMAIPLVIAGTLAFLAIGLLAGSFSNARGRQRGGQPHRAPDGVLVRCVLPPAGCPAVAADHLGGVAAAASGRRHAERDGTRRGPRLGPAADRGAARLRRRGGRCRPGPVPLGRCLTWDDA
jgi:ABC-2 type transport system permease protein